MNKNLVSIIMPTYNAEIYVSDTIQAVLEQEHKQFELIIVNDGSTDRTEKKIDAFLSDIRIKYIKQSNQGCSGAKNTGFTLAKGTYIQYLDADDILSRDKIKEQVAVLENQSMAIAVCRTKSFSSSILDQSNKEIDTEFLYTTDRGIEFVLNLYGLSGKKGMIQPNAFLVTKDLADQIGPYDTTISPSPDEDGEYFCRAMLAANTINFTPQGLNYYRKQPDSRNSLSRQFSPDHAKGALKSIQLITEHLLARENSDRVKKVMARQYADFIYQYSDYKDLVYLATDEIEKLGVKRVPSTGGKNFQLISRLIGFHNALHFKNLSSSVKKTLTK